MRLVTLDFETFYDNKIKLGFKHQTTEEYVRDSRFEVIGVVVKVDDGECIWVSGTHDEMKKFLLSLELDGAAVLCHNTLFDGCILSWHYGIKPAFLLDTLSMARALHGVDAGGSLAKLAERYKLGVKGDEVVAAEGKRREDFSPEELRRYGEYCKNDVDLTFRLFQILASATPDDEFELIDMTLRMFTEPVFEVDDALLQNRLAEVQQEKSDLLRGLMEKLNCPTEEAVRKKLASNKQFAMLLEENNVTPPMKVSKTTGKDTFALAKNDEGFLALTEHEDPFIQQLCAIRLGTKSTIEESRIKRFIDVGKRNEGKLPIPLKYYGAHTGRWAGMDKVNFQNLPSRDKKKKALKNAVLAPDEHIVINCDSSQIEARILVWLAGQQDVVEQFRKGEDVYSIFATDIYNRPISKANPVERFVGKTCISEGTLVLSDSGWKPIEQITLKDKLWDGEEWVCHQGLLNNGIKPTLNLCGAWLTPDHLVWSGIRWLEAQSVVADEDILYQTLDTGAENLPSQATWLAPEAESAPSSCSVTVTAPSTRLTRTTSKISAALAALFAPKQQRLQNAIGCTAKQWQTMHIGLAYSIVSLRQSLGATHQRAVHTSTMEDVVSQCAQNGEVIALRSCDTSRPLKVGIGPISRWIESMWMGIMNREISASYHAAITSATSAKSQTLKRVYDILNCGSRSRFTILTEAGPIIVHNCILGLGYGTGALKLQHTLKTTPPGAVVDEEEAKRIVGVYRDKNHAVIDLWREGDEVIRTMADWGNTKPFYYGLNKCLVVDKEGIRLPNGLYIRYPGLKLDTSEAKSKYVYSSRKGPVPLWGGSLVENVVQGLARVVVGQQMLKIKKRYPVKLTVHDAAVIVAPEAQKDEALEYIIECMSEPPEWAKGLPVACEAKFASSYGEC